MNNIIQSRLAAINEEQRKLHVMQEQAAATRDQALAQLAQYRDLELRLSGAATVLQEVIEAISAAEHDQALQEQEVLEVVRRIKCSNEHPASTGDRLDLDELGMVVLVAKLKDAFDVDLDLTEEMPQTINDVVDFVRRNTVSKK
jgi:acyl carrier protein